MHHRPLGTLVSLGVVGWYSGYVYASFAYLRRRDGGRRAVRRRGHTRRTDGLDDRHGRPAAIILGHVNCVPQELLASAWRLLFEPRQPGRSALANRLVLSGADIILPQEERIRHTMVVID